MSLNKFSISEKKPISEILPFGLEDLEAQMSLDELVIHASMAGSGDARLKNHNAGWIEVELSDQNHRQRKDKNFIRLASPGVVKDMAEEIQRLRQQVADMRK